MSVHFALGLVVGLLFAALAMIASLARYVASDLDAFTRYLDRGGAS